MIFSNVASVLASSLKKFAARQYAQSELSERMYEDGRSMLHIAGSLVQLTLIVDPCSQC